MHHSNQMLNSVAYAKYSGGSLASARRLQMSHLDFFMKTSF